MQSNVYTVLAGTIVREETTRGLERGYDNIKMNLRLTKYEVVEWIYLADGIFGGIL